MADIIPMPIYDIEVNMSPNSVGGLLSHDVIKVVS